MKRIKVTDDLVEKQPDHWADKLLVRLAIETIDRIHEKMWGQKRFLIRKGIQDQRDNRYFKILYRAANYLIEYSEGYTNPLPQLVEDYFTAVYLSYQRRFGKPPYLNQVGPTTANQITFEEWVADWERQSVPDRYLTKDEMASKGEIRAMVQRTARARSKPIILEDFDITEV